MVISPERLLTAAKRAEWEESGAHSETTNREKRRRGREEVNFMDGKLDMTSLIIDNNIIKSIKFNLWPD